jgi:hypothetical protein
MVSKNRRNKVKFKWTKELVFLILGLVAIIAATIVLCIPSSAHKTTTAMNEAIYAANLSNSQASENGGTAEQYNLLPDENVYVELEFDKLSKKLEKEEWAYVLYGSTNSTTVLKNLSVINTLANDLEIETVYYLSSLWVEETTDTQAEEFKEEQSRIEDKVNANKNADVAEFSLLEYPALLVFNNGELVFNSQSYEDDFATWEMFIQKAFFLAQTTE